MSPVVGLVFAAALLLGIAGIAKVLHPAATQVALRTAGLPSARWAARGLGAAEVVLAAVTLAVGGRLGGAIVAVAYLGFAGFSARLLRVGRGGVSCGCFGGDDSPVTRLHVWLNVGLAAAAIVSVLDPGPGLVETARSTPAAGIPFVLFTLLLTWILQVAFTALPALSSAASTTPPRTPDRGTAAPAATPLSITPKPEASP